MQGFKSNKYTEVCFPSWLSSSFCFKEAIFFQKYIVKNFSRDICHKLENDFPVKTLSDIYLRSHQNQFESQDQQR